VKKRKRKGAARETLPCEVVRRLGFVGLLSVFHWLVLALTAGTVQGILVPFGLEDAPSKEEPSLKR
jgi:hypothetical protein